VDFVFGRRLVSQQETVADDSARQHAQQQQEKAEARLHEEQAAVQQTITSLQRASQGKVRLEKQAERARQKQQEAAEEYAAEQKKYMDQMQKNTDAACRQMRQNILHYLEISQDNFTSALRHTLEHMKTGCIQAVRDLLNVNLDQQLERTQKKLDDLIQLIETEGEERTRKLDAAVEQEALAITLLSQGADLCAELETQMNDHVEQEVLS